MKLDDLKDYGYSPDKFDLTNFFSVEQCDTKGGQVETFFNLNEGITVDGIDELNESLVEPYVCKAGDNLRFISYRKYGSIRYWWLIAKINHIYDALETLEPGRKLYLLKKEQMNYIVNQVMQRRSDDAQ